MLLLPLRVFAHPMGNFSINHYARLEPQRTATGTQIVVHYVLDLAEIPTVTETGRMDADHNGAVSPAERLAYLHAQTPVWTAALTLAANGQTLPLELQQSDCAFRPGAGGLNTLRIVLVFAARLPASVSLPCRVDYKDTNFPVRTGWKEIVVAGSPGMDIRGSSAPSTDQSKELTVYPSDPGIAPPQATEAHFTLAASSSAQMGSSMASAPGAVSASVPRARADTPQDKFTQSIAAVHLTPGVWLLALFSAFLFGAFHALSPGHGKAMVAAYLVGTRGTAWHAVLLGLVVTITHTIGVFALGLLTLSAAQYIVPERLYPILSALSGATVMFMGLGLLWQRVAQHRRSKQADADVSLAEENESVPEMDEFTQQRRGTGPVPLKTLIVLGMTGGALPCPSALVVMLSAIALHRIGFGLTLIVAFSAGLAVVLTVLGLVVIRARGFLERIPSTGRLVSGLPIFSAAVVTLIGVFLFVRALSGKF